MCRICETVDWCEKFLNDYNVPANRVDDSARAYIAGAAFGLTRTNSDLATITVLQAIDADIKQQGFYAFLRDFNGADIH